MELLWDWDQLATLSQTWSEMMSYREEKHRQQTKLTDADSTRFKCILTETILKKAKLWGWEGSGSWVKGRSEHNGTKASP